ncbi:MAG: DUF2135 domain-containing protein, partial [Fibromonadales bacterium]|nr:DUF2135 domain-containing protein [Fibromonadales bacterium]
LLFGFGDKVEKRVKIQLDAKKAIDQGNIYKIWAQKKIAELDLNYEQNHAELTELGQQFGIVTRNTSLIVLETLADYVQYNIEPPATEPELLTEYQSGIKGREEQQRNTERNMLNEAVAAAENLKKWQNTDFKPQKPKYPTPDNMERPARDRATSTPRAGILVESADVVGWMDNPNAVFVLDQDNYNSEDLANFLASLGLGDTLPTAANSQPTIAIKPIKKDNDYLNKLTGKPAEDYQIYLKLRNDYASSPTFYFDMANWFYTLGDKETAIRILTSIADLELENASLYRLLGYKFKEYGEHTLQKFVCQKVIQWRPMEPQSYRDYALALADNGETQAALDSLYSLLTKSYSSNIRRRIRGIEEVAVTEINHLIAKNPRLNTSKIDKLLLINIPVDIRVVINWNMNNADIDLHVKDPNNEECSYSKSQTSIGGRISADNTSGYGPEQFLLKKAVKGKYQVYVNYFSKREFAADGPSTVMAEIYTKYGDKSEQRQVVSLQMANVKRTNDNKILVAEFEF